MTFLKVPQFTFGLSACLDPRLSIRQHSLEVALDLDSITLDLFAITRMVEMLKARPPIKPLLSVEALHKSSAPGSTPRVGWASSMSVLTVCCTIFITLNYVLKYKLPRRPLCASAEV